MDKTSDIRQVKSGEAWADKDRATELDMSAWSHRASPRLDVTGEADKDVLMFVLRQRKQANFQIIP